MVCDAKSHYMTNVIPYLEEHTQPPRGVSLAQYVSELLLEPFSESGRIVIGDNWFTSVPLIQNLLSEFKFTYIGTICSNKREIPSQIIDKKNFKPGQSTFALNKNITLCGYLPPQNNSKKKLLLLASSKHIQQTIIEEKKKPEVIIVYNKTKGGIDCFISCVRIIYVVEWQKGGL